MSFWQIAEVQIIRPSGRIEGKYVERDDVDMPFWMLALKCKLSELQEG